MKHIYIIIKIVLISAITFSSNSCRNDSKDNKEELISEQERPKPKDEVPQNEAFESLRNMGLAMTPDKIGLSLPSNETIVYGVIMDWAMGNAVATTVAYQTGDASLYLSSGGGVIGGGQHQRVQTAAKRFVNLGQTYLSKVNKTTTTPLPSIDEVKFYFLTNTGIFVGQEQMKNFENSSSTFMKLFEEGNNVLAELRMVDQQ